MNTHLALVLAGHGSHISPQTAGLVWALVDQIRALNIVDEVTAAFWKEAPSFHQVFDTIAATDVTVVPLFTAQGYFTRSVIPAEMELTDSVTTRNGRTIHYARTLSEHPYLAKVVRQRVEDALRESGAKANDTAVVIIGHGTRRNPDSRAATEAQAALIRESGLAAEAVAVFLDDTPDIPAVYSMTSAPTLIAVPYFLALGSHTTLDVPEELGLEAGQNRGRVNGREVIYTLPVGVDDALLDVVLELARDAGAPLKTPQVGSSWDSFPTIGRDELAYSVGTGGMRFGQLWLTPTEVRTTADIDRDNLTTLDNPSTLRKWVRETHSFRPLPTSNDLPNGWRIDIDTPEKLAAVVETVYPGALADCAANCGGTLKVNSVENVAARQTGMFRALNQLSQAQQAFVVAGVCGNCVRTASWFHGETRPGALSCPEPCNIWMSKALEILK
ncbi:MAG: hypothetical protein H7175_27345 [Burkholderiales bacterium]|nr:hypothetical protein [Anaerolineae bacterium]